MKLLKIAAVTLTALLAFTSCIVINYPSSGIVTLATEERKESTTVIPKEETEELTESVTEPEIDTPTEEATVYETEEVLPTAEETEAVTETTFYEETEAPETEAVEPTIRLIDITSPISQNRTATVTIVGKPYTDYDIKVIYTTQESTAKGLENKTSDDMGIVWWSWKIGASVKNGTYKIIITDGTEVFETQIDVE